MASKLSENLNSIASENNKREAILLNTPDGVLAYEATGTLIHANKASHELLQGVDLGNMGLIQATEFFGLSYTEVGALAPGETCESTLELGSTSIAVTITPYLSQADAVDGYVIVLADISKQKRLENMRKEFVANVSHELRTPLANIRAYTETLLDGAAEDAETLHRFLKVVDNEARRMSHLVSDLLELSSIDSGQTRIDMDVVDLAALLRLVVRQNQTEAAAKRQVIELDTPDGTCFIEANAARINQVVSNCLSNAIKYSFEGTSIRVVMEVVDIHFEVRIVDCGIGIPKESLAHVFERFYRVDKARARDMGGTGLGLSIVKEIVLEHGGQVDISSEPNSGTTVKLRFLRLKEE